MSIIFGPINSRRFGKSLGVDLSPNIKQCNFDCLYCELKPAKTIQNQSDIINLTTVIEEIKRAINNYKDIDVLTITANGEPTLYPYLYELIQEINSFKGDIKTLILSNASTINSASTIKALLAFDIVKLSLDCATQTCFKKLDRPTNQIDLASIKQGMLKFKKEFLGDLIIEILFVEGINDNLKEIEQLNNFLLELQPNRIDIGTIDRPPAYNIQEVSYEKLRELSLAFDPTLPVVVTKKAPKSNQKYNYSIEQILTTLRRRPLTKEDIDQLFSPKSKKLFLQLLDEKQIIESKNSLTIFYRTKE